jgi:hypothetical protein
VHGDFLLEASKPVLSPGPLLRHVVRALNVIARRADSARVQVELQGKRWSGFAHQVFSRVCFTLRGS